MLRGTDERTEMPQLHAFRVICKHFGLDTALLAFAYTHLPVSDST